MACGAIMYTLTEIKNDLKKYLEEEYYLLSRREIGQRNYLYQLNQRFVRGDISKEGWEKNADIAVNIKDVLLKRMEELENKIKDLA